MKTAWYERWNWWAIGILVGLAAFWAWVISQLVPMVIEVAGKY